MSITTVKITGQVRLADNTVPVNADIVFTPTNFVAVGSTAVVPHSLTFPVAPVTGNIDADVWPASGAYGAMRYNVTVVEYEDSLKQVEFHRHGLGSIQVIEAATIGSLIPVPVAGPLLSGLSYRQGDTISLPMIRTSSGGIRMSLDGVTISARMRHKKSGVVTDMGTSIVDAVNGVFEVGVSSAVTSVLAVGEYEWNVAFTSGVRSTSTEYGLIRIAGGLA